jgi:DNA-directed RNA polymerase specialized sigma24 family protein
VRWCDPSCASVHKNAQTLRDLASDGERGDISGDWRDDAARELLKASPPFMEVPMRKPPVFLVDNTGQTFPPRIEGAVTVWLARLRSTFPTLDETAVVEVLEEAGRRLVRRESTAGPIEHVHAYAWMAIRSVAVSRLRLGRERVAQMTTLRLHEGRRQTQAGFAVSGFELEARVLLSQVLGRLTAIERRVFTLKMAGFSSREIGERLDRAPATIDSIHSRAMTRLRRLALDDAVPPTSRTRGNFARRS